MTTLAALAEGADIITLLMRFLGIDNTQRPTENRAPVSLVKQVGSEILELDLASKVEHVVFSRDGMYSLAASKTGIYFLDATGLSKLAHTADQPGFEPSQVVESTDMLAVLASPQTDRVAVVKGDATKPSDLRIFQVNAPDKMVIPAFDGKNLLNPQDYARALLLRQVYDNQVINIVPYTKPQRDVLVLGTWGPTQEFADIEFSLVYPPKDKHDPTVRFNPVWEDKTHVLYLAHP